MKLDESRISNSKLEISNWTDYRADWPVQFEISSFEFEMQDSSNFKFSLSLPLVSQQEVEFIVAPSVSGVASSLPAKARSLVFLTLSCFEVLQ